MHSPAVPPTTETYRHAYGVDFGRPQIFLRAPLLGALDEEFRQANQAFRKWVFSTIGSTPNHPLAFVTGDKFDAGHAIPVDSLKAHPGAFRERLMVQDRHVNRSNQAKRITRADIVDVMGVPVDRATLAAWAKERNDPRLAYYAKKPGGATGGWDATTRALGKELEFVWTTDGPFVRSEPPNSGTHRFAFAQV